MNEENPKPGLFLFIILLIGLVLYIGYRTWMHLFSFFEETEKLSNVEEGTGENESETRSKTREPS